MEQKALCANNVRKQYKEKLALDGVSVTLEPGHIYGLIGRNGAGKTTLLAALTAQIPVTSGEVAYGGEPVWENEKALADLCFSREIGARADSGEAALKVKDYLRMGRLFYPHWDEEYAQALIKQFGLDVKQKIGRLSKGMQSMLTIVLALASRAPVTLLDEPVAGLDVVAREDFYRLLLDDHMATGRTFVISTHILEEGAAIFERVLILKEGKLIEDTPTDDLLARFCAVSGPAAAVEAACEGFPVLHREALGSHASFVVRAPAADITARGQAVELNALSLQKVFVALCGHEQEGQA